MDSSAERPQLMSSVSQLLVRYIHNIFPIRYIMMGTAQSPTQKFTPFSGETWTHPTHSPKWQLDPLIRSSRIYASY